MNNKGFVYLLRPTPELWTISLPHRTQILYAPDMSFITMKLNLSPGASVVEAGTGSGSFTHFLARTVGRGPSPQGGPGQTRAVWAPTTPSDDAPSEAPFGGRVYSYEFHAERAEKAREEFTSHGLNETVVLEHRNVCKNGFSVQHLADAVFLDLPAPWEAVPFAKDALRTDIETRICCFSPCIEQVLRTVTALTECGFTSIATYESLVRTHESLTNVAPLECIGDVVERIRHTESKRESRRVLQIQQSKLERERRQAEKNAEADAALVQDGETPAGTEADGDKPPSNDTAVRRSADAGEAEASRKRKASDLEGEEASKRMAPASPETAPDVPAHEQEPPAEMMYSAGFRQKTEKRAMQLANVYSRTFPTMRGHTSYLTFATLLPRAT